MTNEPYQRSVTSVQDNATTQIREIMAKGLSIDKIISGINAGLERCERQLRKHKFNIDALSRKYELENKLIVAKNIK